MAARPARHDTSRQRPACLGLASIAVVRVPAIAVGAIRGRWHQRGLEEDKFVGVKTHQASNSFKLCVCLASAWVMCGVGRCSEEGGWMVHS
jgi:hypothetical protein